MNEKIIPVYNHNLENWVNHTLEDMDEYFNFVEKPDYNKIEEIHKHFYELEKSEGKQYPNFSLWVDDNDINLLHLLRHFNEYNKHWSIRTDAENWKETIKETKLGKYAC